MPGPPTARAPTISTGAAVQNAAQNVRSKLARLAGWPADQVSLEAGRIAYGNTSRSIQDILGEAGVAELASDGAFDFTWQRAGKQSGSAGFPTRSFGVIFSWKWESILNWDCCGFVGQRASIAQADTHQFHDVPVANDWWDCLGMGHGRHGGQPLRADTRALARKRSRGRPHSGERGYSTCISTWRLSTNSTRTPVRSAPRESVNLGRQVSRRPSRMLYSTRSACVCAICPSRLTNLSRDKAVLGDDVFRRIGRESREIPSVPLKD